MANILVLDGDPAVPITILLIPERVGHRLTVAGDGRGGWGLFKDSRRLT